MPDEETSEIMNEHDLDEDAAGGVRDIMHEYGVDQDDAIELEESGV